jgi:hypothetical protein
MHKELEAVKKEAKVLAESQILPSFYTRFAAELAFSREIFFDHPQITRCREDVIPLISDEYGHGIDHAKKVALEAGAIILVEARPWGMAQARRLCVLAQLCGLLHDTCRLEPDHARRGADLAIRILVGYPLSDRDKAMIAFAIRNHAAFQVYESSDDPLEKMLAASLYDANKFRWGLDNFGTTHWEICDYEEWGLRQILAKYPEGIARIKAIANTFRTEIGRSFGPEFIELGLILGQRLYTILQQCTSHTQDNANT